MSWPNQGGQGFNQGGQGFNQGGQGFNPGGQGFNQSGQGFNQSGQGFNYAGQGFNQGGQGFNPGGQGFNQSGQGFNPVGQGFNPIGQGFDNSHGHGHHNHHGKHHHENSHKDFAPIPGGFYPDPNHLYRIVTCLDMTKCLTVKDGLLGIRHLMIDQYHGNDHQKFTIAMMNGSYMIKSVNGGVLNAVENGDLRVTKDKHQIGELFQIIHSNDGSATFFIKAANGTVVDVHGSSTKNHTSVELFNHHGNTNQKWMFLPA